MFSCGGRISKVWEARLLELLMQMAQVSLQGRMKEGDLRLRGTCLWTCFFIEKTRARNSCCEVSAVTAWRGLRLPGVSSLGLAARRTALTADRKRRQRKGRREATASEKQLAPHLLSLRTSVTNRHSDDTSCQLSRWSGDAVPLGSVALSARLRRPPSLSPSPSHPNRGLTQTPSGWPFLTLGQESRGDGAGWPQK